MFASSSTHSVALSNAAIYFVYHDLRTVETHSASTATIKPSTVVSNATSRLSDSIPVSPLPMETMPGPSGISVPMRPSMGATFEMRSVTFTRPSKTACSCATMFTANDSRSASDASGWFMRSSKLFFWRPSMPLARITSAGLGSVLRSSTSSGRESLK